MKKPAIITRLANLGPHRVDHDLVRRVLERKAAAYADEVRIVGRAA